MKYTSGIISTDYNLTQKELERLSQVSKYTISNVYDTLSSKAKKEVTKWSHMVEQTRIRGQVANVLDQLVKSSSLKENLDLKNKRKDFLQLNLTSIKSQFIKSTLKESINLKIKKSGLILIKGASGQAIQNMNNLFGYPEKYGLK